MSGSVSKRFVAIGHVVNDSAPEDHLGGGVAYSAVAARRLGYEAHVITKCPPDHRYVADLKQMGVDVHPLPTRRDTITSFDNPRMTGVDGESSTWPNCKNQFH
jgi:sugar/nucleoside kinase (ribokinase family)